MIFFRGKKPVAPSPPPAPLDSPASPTNSPARWNIPLRTIARWALVALALYLVAWLLWTAREAMAPFIIGLVLAYFLLPAVNLLARRMPRPAAILIVYLGFILLVLATVAYIIPPIVEQLQQLVQTIPSLEQFQEWGRSLLEQYRYRVPESVQGPVEEALQNALRTAQANLTTYLQAAGLFLLRETVQVISILSFIVGLLIVPIWLFYVLNDQAQGRVMVDRALHPRIRPDFWNVWGIINGVLSAYVRGQLILGTAVGAMVGVGLLVLNLFGIRMNYVLLLAVVAGITELIPIVGPILGAIPGILLALFISPTTTLAVAALYILVQQIENNFLVPRIIGESVGIHPAILAVLLVAMGYTFGLAGVILAAPLSAIARDLFMYAYRRLEGISPAEAWQMSAPPPTAVSKKS